MFNLFPKKKSVDKIIEDADVTPAWQWQPTQTPSMLQAQNDLIEQFLKENHDLKVENQKLKNDWHQPELCDEKIAELTKEVIQLRHLKQENADLMEILAKYRDGYQGSCYACEPVGELNQKQEQEIIALKNELQYQLDQNKKLDLQIVALHKIINGAKETIDELKKREEETYFECNHCGYKVAHDTSYWGGCGFCKDGLMIEKKKELQKHPMYPIHWGGIKVSWEQAASDLALRVAKLEQLLNNRL